MFYQLVKIIVGIGIRLFYRSIKIDKREKLLTDGPQIIIANHPNTLMDALIIGYIFPKPVHFMTKATFFNKPIKRKILSKLKMIPINRPVDSKTDGVNNEDSFESCYQILNQGKSLVVFPEGNSELEHQLRSLKTGAARIALEAENRNQGLLNLRIIPLGLFYDQADSFRSSVLVSVGNQIKVADYIEDYRQNKTEVAKKITGLMRTELERVMFTVDNEEQEKMIEKLVKILNPRLAFQDVSYQITIRKQIKQSIDEMLLTQPYLISEVKMLIDTIEWQTKNLRIHTDFISRSNRLISIFLQLIFSILIFFIGLPLFLFGFIHNVFPFKMTRILVTKFTKSITYYSSLSVLTGLVLYPLTYSAFLMITSDIFLCP